MDPEKNLVTYTALAIVATHDIEAVQAIRQKHDPAFQRWPPHINIAFPFVAPERFEEVASTLTNSFKDFPQFEITFTQVSSFPHGVVFLNPSTNGNELQQVYEIATGVLPEIVNKKHNGFTPHMTIANKVKKHEVNQMRQGFQQKWQEWKWVCKGLHMLERGKDTPFKTAKFIPFKASE